MTNIRSLDMMIVDSLFDMGGGYVLNFSDRTMSAFFAEELNVDIDDPKYRANGNSKARRLRTFLNAVDKPTAVRTLKALWHYREAIRNRDSEPERIVNAEGKFLELMNRLQGVTGPATSQPPAPAFNGPKIALLKQELIDLSSLEPQPRGYAFEKFLKALFDVYGMEARDAFRLRGEQIDGSFLLGHETYLLEAKWQNAKTGQDDLHGFHGKLEQKAAWSRGLFISNSGFTDDGLYAFGRGKRVICMDGLDLYESMNRQIPLNHVLERKVRHAAETGAPFASMRMLFPA